MPNFPPTDEKETTLQFCLMMRISPFIFFLTCDAQQQVYDTYAPGTRPCQCVTVTVFYTLTAIW